MTALVVKFSAQSVGEGGGVLQRRNEREQSTKVEDDEIFSQAEEEDVPADSLVEKKVDTDMDEAPSDEEIYIEPIAL